MPHITLISYGTLYRDLTPPLVDYDVSALELAEPDRPRTGDNTGTSPLVQASLEARNPAKLPMLLRIIRKLASGPTDKTIAVHCLAGHQRSVATVELAAESLRARGNTVTVEHRDRERRVPRKSEALDVPRHRAALTPGRWDGFRLTARKRT